MSEIASQSAYKRLRTPSEDGKALFDPPMWDEAAFLQQNIALRHQCDCDIFGMPLHGLRSEARADLLSRGRQYTRAYRELPDTALGPDAPLILVGHQPELVHPGVWFKNFVLSELAERTSSHAVNLLIDNDAVRSTAIRVPTGSIDNPVALSIAMDRPAAPIPYEHCRVLDPAVFASFGQRVISALSPLIPDPLIRQLWPYAIEGMRRSANLGQALAQARHTLEGQWGLATIEVPLSHVCDDRSFRWFAAHLLRDAERLREIHNQCLIAYRRVNKIRSHTHPVPELVARDGSIEVPFWLWHVDRPERRGAYVQRTGSSMLLSDRHQVRVNLPLPRRGDASALVEALEQAHRNGIRLRPRALITTMYARLVLSDVFIHGIGGAKYDQLTDAIVRGFFGIEPPEHLVVTATLKLPICSGAVEPRDVTRIDRILRELRFHPELHVDATSDTRPLIKEKQRWLQYQPPAGQGRERHENLKRLNTALGEFLVARHHQLVRERVELRSLLRKQAILNSREYPFCLFPAQSLRSRLLELSRQEP